MTDGCRRFMRSIYLDYNLIAIMAGRTRQNAAQLENHLHKFRGGGDRIALSAWHALELSRSNDDGHIQACIELVDRLEPVWLSNPSYVKTEEIKKFLATEFGSRRFQPHSNPAFNVTVSQMWSTYGETIVGETFSHTVWALHNHAPSRETIDNAVRQTPKAILIGREAMKNGRGKTYEAIIDREYFASLAPRGASSGEIDCLVANVSRVLETCPAIAVEDYLTRIRATESFVPEESDAADLQHATLAVAYCDYFSSDDKMLLEHCRRTVRQLGIDCTLVRSPMDLPIG